MVKHERFAVLIPMSEAILEDCDLDVHEFASGMVREKLEVVRQRVGFKVIETGEVSTKITDALDSIAIFDPSFPQQMVILRAEMPVTLELTRRQHRTFMRGVGG